MMTIPEILQALAYFSEELPREALGAASEQKEALTPVLLAQLEAWKGQFSQLGDNEYLHIYSFFLLAEFREKRAYPLIVDLMIEAGDKADPLFGDVITEELSNILASVYDGDPGPLLRLINTAQNEYVRGSGIQALVIVYLNGQLSRGELLHHLETLGQQFLDAGDEIDDDLSYLAAKLICECLSIYGTELTELIEALYDADVVDRWMVNPGDVQQEFAEQTLETALARYRQDKTYQLIESTVQTMEQWYCFMSEEDKKQQNETVAAALAKLLKNDQSFGPQRQKAGDASFGAVPKLALGMEGSSRQKKGKQKQQKLSRKKNRQKKK